MPRLYPALAALAILLLTACGGSGSSGRDLTSVEPFRAQRPQLTALPPGYRIESLLDGLDLPTAIASTPDGRLLITEQTTGRVRVVEGGVLLDEPWVEIPVYYLPDTFLQELGLVGITVDPEFEENRYVYLYYTEPTESGHHTVLARARDENGRATDLTPILTIERAPEKTHIAGGLAFDNTGALLVGVGDHEESASAQRLGEPAGKILRIDRDGNAPPDNPFVDREGADPRVYAYGVRNPFGIAVDRANGRMYLGDNREIAGDALYELEAGANYGWPDHPVVLREPLLIYEEPLGVAGVTVYNGTVLPDFTGDVFFCTFHGGGGLHWSDTDALAGFDLARRDRLIAPGCSTGVTTGADGFLYFLTYGGQLLRISR